MPTPGAAISTTGPKFENHALFTLLSTAPTVIVPGHAAGIKVDALTPALPAATTTVLPWLVAYAIAAQVGLLSTTPAHPRLILITSIPCAAA